MKLLASCVAAGFALAASVVGSPAVLAADGACTTNSGITVIVDAADLGAGVSQRCALDEPTSGFDVLVRAGFEWTPVSNSPALLCRIDGLPTADDEACDNAPPLNAYWAYFRADRGGDWQYSQTGAHSRPSAGTVVGWVFLRGNQRVPGIAPPIALPSPTPVLTPTPSPTPTPSRKPPPKPTSTPLRPAPLRPTPKPTAEQGPAAVRVPAVPTAATPRASATSTGAAIEIGPPTRITLGAPPTDTGDSGQDGSWLSFAIGVGTAIALLLAAIAMEIRRRHSISR